MLPDSRAARGVNGHRIWHALRGSSDESGDSTNETAYARAKSSKFTTKPVSASTHNKLHYKIRQFFKAV